MKEKVTVAFKQRFGERPSHLIRSPGRVNLIGEHTDYNDGFVLPMAIDRAVWLAVSAREDGRVRAYSLEESEPADFALNNFQYTGGWAEYIKGMARMLLDAGRNLTGWEGVLTSDVPVGSGLSSSAALEMAVGMAFAAVSNFPFDSVEMARLGQKTENEWV
ncbi:MAG: galactokinase, partial [Chloroflexi bacterium]|nr:galactokinase [Chloroflexota bacterium]